MREFWRDSGYHLLGVTAEGRLAVSDDFLRAYLMRPEIRPVEESCTAERALHERLMTEPRRAVGEAAIEVGKEATGRIAAKPVVPAPRSSRSRNVSA